MELGQYGDMLLYAVWYKEISNCMTKGSRIMMFEFNSRETFDEWITTGKHENRVVFSCYLLDSNLSNKLQISHPDLIDTLRTIPGSVALIPYTRTGSLVVPIHFAVYKSDTIGPDNVELLLLRHTEHSKVK